MPDVGGGFGMKIHIYGDEMAAVAASLLLGRPVKFVADRLESFVGDFHARGHRVRARMALSKDGDILGVEADDLYGIGPYSGYPRGSANEGLQVSNLVCAGYRRGAYRAVSRAVFQNKAMYGQYRAVGHPVACLVSEGLMDLAAAKLGADPAEFRRRHYLSPESYPLKLAGGPVLEKLSQHEALETLLQLMDYAGLRTEQKKLRTQGIHRGIGLASFVENSNPSAATYGQGGVSIASQDSCTLKLTATGGVVAASSITECGQGGYAVIQQVVAAVCGVPFAQEAEFDTLMDAQRTRSRAGGGRTFDAQLALEGEPTTFTGYEHLEEQTTVVGGTTLPPLLCTKASMRASASTLAAGGTLAS